jgi:cold shock CspA family protein
MKDRILESYLRSFTSEYGFETLEESLAFEYFVNFCAVSRHHPDPFDPEDISVGGNGDLGLDGLAIIVNDKLVSSVEHVDYLKKQYRRLEVEFVLTQAKTSPRFSSADIGTFISGARHFFESSIPDDANDRLREMHRIKEHIFDSSIDMDRTPTCRLYYATTGSWTKDQALRTRVEQGVTDLRQTGLFSVAEFRPLDSEGLKNLYRELNQKITREIQFDKHAILPGIEGVQEAYIGIVPCLDYLGLITDDDEELNRRLFYDNVRDFQGHNPVNQEIERTIRDEGKSDRFALLNNGVTIVAGDINKVGAKFRLKDFQVVNGCQTSHIIYQNRKRLTPKVYVPIKLIVTTDAEVTNQIIQGTNRQTEVKLEAFESLSPFQKKLEEFYLAMGRDRAEPLYYERRSKQYEHLDVSRNRIITLGTQINCFIAMFLNEPQSTHRYYGELLTSYGHGRLFSSSHSPYPYYLSGAALATLERQFASGRLPRVWRPLKYQLLMVYRLQTEPRPVPLLNKRAIDDYCDEMLQSLDDDQLSEAAFTRAGQLVESVRDRIRPWREPPERTRAFTAELVAQASRGHGEVATTSRSTGTVSWFSETRGYGFIDDDGGSRFFVHYNDIAGSGYRSLAEGQRVTFVVEPVEGSGHPKAIDVDVLVS